MPTLTWNDTLEIQQPTMDATHREFVQLLGSVELALDGPAEELLRRYRHLVEHTVEHFAQEDRWMLSTGFAAENCHTHQHAQVLEVMREVLAHAEAKQDLLPLQRLLPELVNWFPVHAQTMDMALALHMQQAGFDPATGECRVPAAQRQAAPITGCGSATCS